MLPHTQSLYPKITRRRSLIIIGLIILGIILISSFYLREKTTKSNISKQNVTVNRDGSSSGFHEETQRKTTLSPRQLPDHRLVYAEYDSKTDHVSIVQTSYDGKRKKTVVSLPDSEIKSLQSVNDTTFIYIAQLDGMGRGKSINMAGPKKSSVLLTPIDGYLFDQLYLSWDKKRIAVWEVEDTFYLRDAKTRIVVYNINQPSTSRRIIIEQSGASGNLYYPVFWGKDNKTLYVDTLNPNGGTTYLGFIALDTITGSQTLVLQKNKYSSLPVLSPDGKKIAFTAYDANKQPISKSKPSVMFPIQVLNPNTLVIYDLEKKESPYLLLSIADTLFYSQGWGPDSTSIYTKAVNPKSETNQLIIMDATTGTIRQYLDTEAGVFIWFGDDTIALSAKRLDGFWGTGIFSGTIVPTLGVYLYDFKNKTYQKVYSDKPIQLIL